MRQGDFIQEGVATLIGIGLSEREQLHAGRTHQSAQRLNRSRVAHQENHVEFFREQGLCGGGGVEVAEDRRFAGDAVGLKHGERERPRRTALGADRDAQAFELREPLDRRVAAIEYPKRLVAYAAERHEAGEVFLFHVAARDEADVGSGGLQTVKVVERTGGRDDFECHAMFGEGLLVSTGPAVKRTALGSAGEREFAWRRRLHDPSDGQQKHERNEERDDQCEPRAEPEIINQRGDKREAAAWFGFRHGVFSTRARWAGAREYAMSRTPPRDSSSTCARRNPF